MAARDFLQKSGLISTFGYAIISAAGGGDCNLNRSAVLKKKVSKWVRNIVG
jgi:hypothetical protein